MEEHVKEETLKVAIDNIRPYLQRDGGDVEFISYTDDNVVKVKLKGACAGCPHSQMTIKLGIERILKEQYPEIEAVESV